MREILIISGFIMIVFSYQSFSDWQSHKNENDSNNKKNQRLGLSEK